MIRVVKGEAPETLKRLGPKWVKAHSEAFDAEPKEFLSGKRTMAIASHVYGAAEVRNALAKAQHGKCCFCEVEIEHPYMQRHVEHWRPKGAVKQDAAEPELYPGYYWLAYEWDNLFLACVVCNSSYKSTCFPLADQSNRARSHHDSVDLEIPLLLKPDANDPDEHLTWEDDQPRGTSALGWRTIEVAGLIRKDDVKRTRRFLELKRAYDRLIKITDSGDPTVQQIAKDYRDLLHKSVLASSPFSAMAKAFLASRAPVP
ncbi:hypothetical protein [uncultured Enterovirga sp.]|uniref:hypothetical protein n=1 Tax=uncultured Enterovirga sp. TaxID=2026352 RepID=UPI0035C9F8E7